MDKFTFFFCKVCSLGFSIPPCLVSKKDTGVSDFFFLESVEANAFSQPCNCTMRSFGISLSWLSDARQRRNLLPGTRYGPGRIRQRQEQQRDIDVHRYHHN